MPAVYFIASYDITDVDRYEREYVPGVAATLAVVGGEVVVATGSAAPLEGEAQGQSVVLWFPSEEAFRSWYEGDDYAPLRRLRLETTTGATAVLAKEFAASAPDS